MPTQNRRAGPRHCPARGGPGPPLRHAGHGSGSPALCALQAIHAGAKYRIINQKLSSVIITDGHPLLSNNERFGCRVAAPAAGSRPKRGTKASAVCRQLGMRLLDSTRVARTSYVAALREARDQEPIAIRENPIVLSIDTWRTLTAINSSPPPPSVPPIAESHSQIPCVYQHPVVSRRILTLPNQRDESKQTYSYG